MPRAELWAATMAAHAATSGQHICMRIDAAYVVKRLQCKHRQTSLRSSPNGDLCDALLELMERKSLVVVAETVKSHAVKQVCHIEVDLKHFLGNLLADGGPKWQLKGPSTT